MHHLIPHIPQQSGGVERKNRSLKEMATCTMEDKTLPPKFWADAIKCASYIQNRVPHKYLYGITPFKSWIGHKPDVTHFRIFSSKAWARIPTKKRKALQPQSQECLFVRYYENSKGYKLINLSTNKYFIEISVQFEEDPLAAVEVGESSSPPEPLIVSEETNEFVDYDMSDNYYLIAYPNSHTRTKWTANTIHATRELAGNPSDTRRTRSQFESALCMKDPLFSEK